MSIKWPNVPSVPSSTTRPWRTRRLTSIHAQCSVCGCDLAKSENARKDTWGAAALLPPTITGFDGSSPVTVAEINRNQ